MTTIRIAMLTGGSTPERGVALAGARQVTAALRSLGYEVAVFDTCLGYVARDDEDSHCPEGVDRDPPSPEQLVELQSREDLLVLLSTDRFRRVDLVWPLLHGREGEGGRVQSLLEANGQRFVGSDARGSTLAMDKAVSKTLLRAADVPTADWSVWRASESVPSRPRFPCIVKPSRVGSTVGLTLVRQPDELEPALQHALAFDDEVLIEDFLPGKELTVGVLGERALAVGEIRTRGEVFDFESKYQPGAATEIFPAEVPEHLAERCRDLAERTHACLKLRDLSRVDFRLDAEGNVFCLEANTLPGMTRTSLLPQSAAASGLSFADTCRILVEMALAR